MSNVFFFDNFSHTAAPNALCGNSSRESQGDFVAVEAVPVTLTNGSAHWAEVGELHVGITRFFGGGICGSNGSWTLFDVDLEDLSESLKFFLHRTGGDVPWQAAHEQSPSGLWMKLFEFGVGRPEVESSTKEKDDLVILYIMGWNGPREINYKRARNEQI